jgi:hypothetical protein
MRKIITLFALVLFINAYGQDEKSYQSHWRDTDANALKMPDESYGFFKKGNLLYYISNDRDNLYIDIKIEDSGVQYKILQEGLTVWFNADGKLRKEVGIRYPLGAKFAKGPGMRNSGASGPSPLAMANTIQLIGFPGTEQNMIPAKNTDNFSGSVVYDEAGNLFYNLRIPISKLPFITSEGGAGFESSSIGIEYGGIPEAGKKPGQQAPAQISEEMPSGGRGGGGGGGRGGPGGGGGSARGSSGGSMSAGPSAPPAPAADAAKLIWIKKFSLADQR